MAKLPTIREYGPTYLDRPPVLMDDAELKRLLTSSIESVVAKPVQADKLLSSVMPIARRSLLGVLVKNSLLLAVSGMACYFESANSDPCNHRIL